MYFFKSFLRVILRIKKEKIRRYKELVKKILKAGEIMEVYREIEKVSGYNQDEDEQEKEEEDIKNS